MLVTRIWLAVIGKQQVQKVWVVWLLFEWLSEQMAHGWAAGYQTFDLCVCYMQTHNSLCLNIYNSSADTSTAWSLHHTLLNLSILCETEKTDPGVALCRVDTSCAVWEIKNIVLLPDKTPKLNIIIAITL